jgi:fermentation-respiration switch protein FrsA (DUF1100 family)
MDITVVFKVSKKPDGTLMATMDIPTQGAKDIPVDKVILKNNTLRLEMKSIQGVFEGNIKDDKLTIDGQWNQNGSFPLVLEKVEKAPEIRRPQEPKKPYPYDEEEVIYENKKAGIKLAGTLTLPRDKKTFPAVLLIQGSGPLDRNETILGHRPFKVLADYLTRRGIAVLRADKRGISKSPSDFLLATGEDFASDVLAGVEYLKSRKEINPKKIGLIGHSEGGFIAPMVAVQSPDVAFIVMWAGPGLTGEETLCLQMSLMAKAKGVNDEMITKGLKLQERLFAEIKQEKNNTAAEKELRKILTNGLKELSPEEKEAMNLSEATMGSQTIQYMLSSWYRYFLTYDPKPTLKKVKCPVLAINGEKDLQVPAKANLSAIEECLKAGGNKYYTIKELPGLNHLFQPAATGAVSEYGKIEETISPTALKIIGDWVLEQTGEK